MQKRELATGTSGWKVVRPSVTAEHFSTARISSFTYPFIFQENLDIHASIFENLDWLNFIIIGFWFRNLGYYLSQYRIALIEEEAGWCWIAKMTSSHYFPPFWLFKIQKLSSPYLLFVSKLRHLSLSRDSLCYPKREKPKYCQVLIQLHVQDLWIKSLIFT